MLYLARGGDIVAERAYKYRIYPNKSNKNLFVRLSDVQGMYIIIILINEKLIKLITHM